MLFLPSRARGGCEEYALTLCRGLVHRGCHVEAAVHRLRSTASLVSDLEAAGVRCHRSPPAHLGRGPWGVPARQAAAASRVIRRRRPDVAVIVLPCQDAAIGTMIGVGRSGCPALVVFQNAAEPVTIATRWRHMLQAVGHTQEWIAVSNANRRQIRRNFGAAARNVTTVHNGIATASPLAPRTRARRGVRSMLGLPADAVVLLTVARLARQKGHDILLRAIPTVIASGHDVHVLWIGDGEERHTLAAAARRMGLTDRVHLLGWRTDVPRWLSAADLFVLPSRWEGLSLALLEAMMHDLPIIASSIPSNREVVRHGREALLCRVGDADRLAAALLRGLNHPGEMKRMARAARRRVQCFGAARMVDRTLARMQHLLARRSTPETAGACASHIVNGASTGD
jgi:glycosyltransferase involved in cell wall biosynthesis